MKSTEQKPGRNLSQVIRLCLKDFTGNKGIFLVVAISYLLWISMVIGIGKKFKLIMVLFPMLMIDALKRFEDKYKSEVLFCSLPVKRSSLVYAKYLSSLVIIIITAVLSYISVLLLNTLLPMVLQGAGKLVTAPQVFTILSVYVLFVAVSFLIYFRFGYPGYPAGILIDILVTATVAIFIWGFIYVIVSLASGSWKLAQYSGKAIHLPGEYPFFIFTSLLLAAFTYASIYLSVRFYKKRDL